MELHRAGNLAVDPRDKQLAFVRRQCLRDFVPVSARFVQRKRPYEPDTRPVRDTSVEDPSESFNFSDQLVRIKAFDSCSVRQLFIIRFA